MKTLFTRKGISLVCFVLIQAHALAQDQRTQYPPGLKESFFGVSTGSISYPFSGAQLEPGFTVQSVDVPHTAVRVTLYGCRITDHLSGKITYMRPVQWVQYRNLNGDREHHSVWMNIAGLSLDAKWPLHKKLSLSAEAGLAIITRNGFEINNVPVVKNANYATGMFGGAFHYHTGKKWDLLATAVWSPANNKVKQPTTFFFGAGFQYHLRELSPEKVKYNASGNYIFPKEILLAGYTSNGLGYGVNNFLSQKASIFWGGGAHIRHGFSLGYQRNIFHTRKVFAMDWAAGIGFWQSRDKRENLFTVSLNPVLRFNVVRAKPMDIFFEYSVAGPSFISKTRLDNVPLGRKFTFHDFMGIGLFAGERKRLHAGLRIAHYSNGNLFPENDGVKVPLTLNLGYVLRK